MERESKGSVRPIIAEDFDGPPGMYYAVCPACRCMVDYLENPCRQCGQRLNWRMEKEKDRD
jgi:hypothetical protein